MTHDSTYPKVSGFDQVSDTDLVSRISGVSLDDATEVLDRIGGLRYLATSDPEELTELPGIGPVTAMRLLAAVELGRRLEATDIDQKSFVSSTDVARYFMPRLRDLRKEVFMVLLLDARNALIRGVTVSVGSLTASIVHPREVFKPAILASAASVIFVHNHPSGDPTPSQDDLKITAQLVEAGQLLDIKVLDHIIIGRGQFCSMASKGLI